MKQQIILIRHGATPGNLRRRYIGSTDEPLSESGVRQVRALREALVRFYPSNWGADVFVSPLLRTRQTAQILFEHVRHTAHIEPDLRECDFGAFENKNYQELSGNEDYQRWIDSGGTMAFPGGESPEAFQARCRQAFLRIMERYEDADRRVNGLFLVVHGGTIMSIASAFAVDETGAPRDYYGWHLENGQAFVFEKVGSVTDDHFLRRTGRIGLGEETGAECK